MPRVIVLGDRSCLLAFRVGERVALLGSFSLSVVAGQVKSCGAVLSWGFRQERVTAPFCDSALTLSVVEHPMTPDRVSDPELAARAQKACERLTVHCVVKLDSMEAGPLAARVTGENSAGHPLIEGVWVAPEDHARETVPDAWEALARELVGPVILVCGRRGTGKSFFSRFLCNALPGPIAYLETDLGQSSLVHPTLVSVHRVDAPLLGGFQQHKPEQSVLCAGTSPEPDPQQYVDAVRHLVKHASHLGLPMVVNTHGWITGLGLEILAQILRFLKPQFIVQLYSDAKSDDLSSSVPKGSVLVPLPMVPRTTPKQTISNALRRSIALSEHFGCGPLTALPQYSVPLSALTVCIQDVCVPDENVFALLNGCVVGLLELPAQKKRVIRNLPVCNCVGLGIVRAIDPVGRLLHLVSNVAASSMALCSAIALSSLKIPPSLLGEEAPYVTSERSVGQGFRPMKAKVIQRRK